jgi:hypothetical protein
MCVWARECACVFGPRLQQVGPVPSPGTQLRFWTTAGALAAPVAGRYGCPRVVSEFVFASLSLAREGVLKVTLDWEVADRKKQVW